MNIKTTIRKRCPYCQIDARVVGYSVRDIPGYKNHLTGKENAIVETLSCGHQYIDNKFDLNSIYFTNPINKTTEILQKTIDIKEININVNHRIIPDTYHKKGGINLLDIICLICLVFLAFACPPLTILPLFYFIGRVIR